MSLVLEVTKLFSFGSFFASIQRMLKIRLQRFGKKHEPNFRVVLTDSRNGPKSGKFLEVLGWYHPHRSKYALKGDRILGWISKGAQTSGTMHNLLIKEGIIKGKKVDVASKKKSKKKEASAEKEKSVDDAEQKTGETAKDEQQEKQEEIKSSPPEAEITEKEEEKAEEVEPQAEKKEDKKSPDSDSGNRGSSTSEPNQNDLEDVGKKERKKAEPKQDEDAKAEDETDTKEK